MLAPEEEMVWNVGSLFLVSGETVEVKLLVCPLFSAIQALEQTAIEERHVGKLFKRGAGITEVVFVAIKCVYAVGGAVLLKPFIFGKCTIWLPFGILAHALIQRGEEKVLEDGLVVGRAIGRKVFQNPSQVRFGKEFFGDKALLLEEPAENESSEQTNQASGTSFFVVLLDVGRKIDLRQCPEIPVGEFPVEALVEELDIEDLFPRCVKLIKVLYDATAFGQLLQRERRQDVQVAWMRLFDDDVLNQRDLAQHILTLVALVQAAVDRSNGKPPAYLEQHHHWHREDPIDLAGNACELAARVFALGQFDGDKDVGLE